jgi:hypothetical protein
VGDRNDGNEVHMHRTRTRALEEMMQKGKTTYEVPLRTRSAEGNLGLKRELTGKVGVGKIPPGSEERRLEVG